MPDLRLTFYAVPVTDMKSTRAPAASKVTLTAISSIALNTNIG